MLRAKITSGEEGTSQHPEGEAKKLSLVKYSYYNVAKKKEKAKTGKKIADAGDCDPGDNVDPVIERLIR